MFDQSALSRFARADLGFWPTPLCELPRLSAQLGAEIWIKRDDQSGLGMGGNKVRKLEYLIGDALAQGCDCLVTGGAAQSNHCRQTAAAAAAMGLDCHLLLAGAAPATWTGNLLLSRTFGAEIAWAGQDRTGRGIPEYVRRLRQQGKRPYAIPYGGSNAVGALGFVNAAFELARQLAQRDLRFSHLIVASSSGGTQVGLELGRLALGLPFSVIGVAIDKAFGQSDMESALRRLADQTLDLLGGKGIHDDIAFRLWHAYSEPGYAIVTERERDAIDLFARSEGVLVDPVYTGRALAGLIDRVRRGAFSSRDRVLFWHTGGTPALFSERSLVSESGA